eukprot:CAMPEP_0175389768 /NCGR_PEP_ID=MMETSP0095-20121207/31061_1 /TAXON_ID=311494 /ORGANISM="Alexandrium monilatum, Strain CCMP3105" /LENGTH=315 /DNA_ID=CAMNT_0016688293 /DNA_START=17 /DNA_END=964 /DNA_ORIENTATION=-
MDFKLSPQHPIPLQRFLAMADDEARTELEHQFLDHAKGFEWEEVKSMLARAPDLINVQPAGRWTALHQAAFAGDKEMSEWLVEKGSDLQALTHARKTPLQVAKGDAKDFLKRAAGTGEPEGEAAEKPVLPAAEPASGEAPTPEKKEKADTPPKKKAKVDPVYTLNINGAVDKEFEGSSFKDIAAAPTSALQGIADKGRAVLRKFGVKTIRDLGTWKYYKIAKAIVGLSALEEKGKREEGAGMNINKALVKKHEVDALQDIVKLPPSALQGLAEWTDLELASLHIKTIGQLGEWKFAKWSEWIVDLAEFESKDFSS